MIQVSNFVTKCWT